MTLELTYGDLRRDLARMLAKGRGFSEGTVTIASGVVTLSGGTWPSTAADERLELVADPGNHYTVDTRDSDTQITLDDTSVTQATATGYWLHPWSDDDLVDFASCVRDGLLQFYHPPPLPAELAQRLAMGRLDAPYQWRFLRPEQTIDVWPDTTGTISGTPSESGGVTTVNATESVFYDTMVGESFVVGSNSYPIATYVTATQIKVTGDASSETGTFTIASDGNYFLPSTFAGIDGPLTFATGVTWFPPLKIVNEVQIRHLRQRTTSSGRPRVAAIQPLAYDATVGQRFRLMLYPEPDQYYQLAHRGQVHVDTLTLANLYALGGPAHSLTVKESILSCAEAMLDDTEGLHRERFFRQLAQSIQHDRQAHTAETVGHNLDRSDRGGPGYGRGRRRSGDDYYQVTYNGVFYDGS